MSVLCKYAMSISNNKSVNIWSTEHVDVANLVKIDGILIKVT